MKETLLEDLRTVPDAPVVELKIRDHTKYFDHQAKPQSSGSTSRAAERPMQVDQSFFLVSQSLLSECKLLQSSSNELLRHFWASIGTRDRLERIGPALANMQSRIGKFEETLPAVSDQNQCKGLLSAVKTSIKAALARYDTQ
ncbi:hypothetical protein HDU91_001804 [Kappamyces sp. JEL0680]|nr:hypothetical protein HDU91_001804 [Kappamyces sp. JEL0680]